MNRKRLTAVTLLAGIALFWLILPPTAQGQQAEPQKQEKEKVYIPNDVKAIMLQGLAARQGRADIPFAVSSYLYLPYFQVKDLMHHVFGIKVKNADLGFAPVPAAAAPVPVAKDAVPAAAEPAAAADMQASFDVFLQFHAMENGAPTKVVKEVYVPTSIRIAAAEYAADKEESYFVAYDLPAGQYLLAMVLTSLDMKKIGLVYYEFTSPGAASLGDKIDTTPLFLAKNVEQMAQQETRTFLHRSAFTYLVLKIAPKINNVLHEKESLDLFYFVLGAKPDAQQKYALETNFEVKKGEEIAIRYAPAVYDSPFTSLPLPLKQTVKKKTDAGETKEERDLAAGKYTLTIKILDKNSNQSTTKTLDFEII